MTTDIQRNLNTGLGEIERELADEHRKLLGEIERERLGILRELVMHMVCDPTRERNTALIRQHQEALNALQPKLMQIELQIKALQDFRRNPQAPTWMPLASEYSSMTKYLR